MLFLILSFVAVTVPYGFERIYFARRFGIFSFLFWMFVFQTTILVSGAIIAGNQVGQSLPHWVNLFGVTLGAYAYFTIGMTPIMALMAAALVGAVIAAKSFGKA